MRTIDPKNQRRYNSELLILARGRALRNVGR